MTRTLALIATLSLPATANDPIRVYLDGNQVGTLSLLEYRLADDEIHITTFEGVIGCGQDVAFRDRFERHGELE